MAADWSQLTGFFIGVGLSAACGFRLILPFLGLGIAARCGLVGLAPEFQWIASWPALVAFATAALVEIAAYAVPWLDNLLDTAAAPLAVVAGTVSAAAVFGDIDPFLKWSIALIAGGGMAGIVQTGTTLLRGLSTVTTGGLGNVAVAAAELAGSLLTTLLALLAPLVAFIAACLVAAVILWRLRRRPSQPGPPPGPQVFR